MKSVNATFLIVLAIGLIRCGGGDDDNDSQSLCSDSACYAKCLSEQWTEETPSWMKREAICNPDNTCSCIEGCDDELCNSYCQQEQGLSGGQCFLVCDCESDTEADTETDTGSDTDSSADTDSSTDTGK